MRLKGREFRGFSRMGILGGIFAMSLCLTMLLAPLVAGAATLLPLTAEMATTLPSGNAEATLGLSYFKDMRWPAFTPAGSLRRQTLLQAPQLGFRIGAGDWAEIQATFEMIYLNEKTASGDTHRHFGNGDARLATKVHVVREREWIPAFGLHFGAKLPNADRDQRLGTDDTDFWIAALASKDLGWLDVHANLGMLLLGNSGSTLGDTFNAGGQDDLFTYVFAATSKPLALLEDAAVELRALGEITGWSGSRYDNDRANGRLGLQLAHGASSLFLGTSFGFVTGNENIGVTAGYIYRFEPARLFTCAED